MSTLTENQKERIMLLFWNTHDNRDSTIAKIIGVPRDWVCIHIAAELDKKYDKLFNTNINT